MGKIVYINNPSRAHKLLPLLEGIPVQVIKSWRDLFALRRAVEPNTMVLIDNLGRFGVLGFGLSILLRAPLVVRLRGEFFREERERVEARLGWFRWVRYWGNNLVARLCLWQARMVICNSRYLEQAMSPYLRNKTTGVVHNPYTALQSAPGGEDVSGVSRQGFRLLTVTNMSLRSKVQPIIDAISEWIPLELWERLDLQWTICGTGYHEERLRTLVAQKGLEQRIYTPGRVKNPTGLYEWCDVLVHLTQMDAFPNVPMEAMVNGKPVVTNVCSCGTREQVFDDHNGFVVSDAESFIGAIRAYAGDRGLRERHAQAGRRLVEENFSVAAQRDEMHRMLSQLYPVETDVP